MTAPRDPATGSIPTTPDTTPEQTRATLDAFAAWCLRRAADGRRSRGARIRAAAAADHAREYLREATP